MKFLRALFVLTAGWNALATRAVSQDYAPASLASQFFSTTVLTGSPPFTVSGAYKFFTSPLGSNFVALGNVEGGLIGGTYTYTKTGTNIGVAALMDAQSGLQTSLNLLFDSPSSGQIALTNARSPGFQTTTFMATKYTTVVSPQFFLPAYDMGTFHAYLSGQAGAVYSLEASTDLLDWLPVASLALAGQTGSFTATNAAAPGSSFFRARAVSLDFAPNSINGQALNMTITDGATPFVTSGFFQFVADIAGPGYQLIAGPGMTNTPGVCTYAKFAPGAAVIAAADSQGATNYFRLAFTSPTSGFYYMTNTAVAGFQAGNFTMANSPVVYLGNLRYTPDSARAASLSFPADGNPASLSVTDAVGNSWTLSLPADALLEPRTITMTPTASVDASGAALPASAAVLLAPDGIQFSDGVTLTLTTPAALGTNASLMVTAEDGSGINLVATTNQANRYSTILFHFSSIAVTDPTAQQLQTVQANVALEQQAYNQAKSDVLALEASQATPPPPPDDEWTCDPASQAQAAQAADAYMAGIFADDNDATSRLLSAAALLTRVGVTSAASEAAALVVELLQTDEYRKVSFLLKSYGTDPEKLPIVARVALQVDRQDVLLGGSGRPDWINTLVNDLNSVGAYYLGYLRDQHDYSSAYVIFTIVKKIQLLGGQSSLISKVASALTFQLTMDITVTEKTTGSPSISLNDEAKGVITLALGATSTNLQGSGTCNYVSGQQTGQDVTANLAPSQSFPENATLALNDCPSVSSPTATFTFDQFGSANETWIYPVPLGAIVIPVIQGSYGWADYKTATGYSFTVPLQNGNAQAVNTTIAPSPKLIGNNNNTLTFQLLLQHTPK